MIKTAPTLVHYLLIYKNKNKNTDKRIRRSANKILARLTVACVLEDWRGALPTSRQEVIQVCWERVGLLSPPPWCCAFLSPPSFSSYYQVVAAVVVVVVTEHLVFTTTTPLHLLLYHYFFFFTDHRKTGKALYILYRHKILSMACK